MAEKSGFGSIRKLPSGRYQARYTGPTGERVTAPMTFRAKIDAQAWLIGERKQAEDPTSWLSPQARLDAAREAAEEAERRRPPLFSEYADRYLAARRVKGRPLEQSTLRVYRTYLRLHILPTFGDLRLDQITPGMANEWHDNLPDKPKTRRECYALARSIMTEATGAHGPLVGRINPFAIRGAGSGSSPQRTELVTATELEVLRAEIRPEWDAMIMLALWCGLRFGELTALRRSDVNLERKVVHIRRAISVAGDGNRYEKAPKSAAGVRDQRIPGAVAPVIKKHLRTYVTGRDGLLFPGPQGGLLYSSVFHGAADQIDKHGKVIRRGRPGTWYAARQAAGRNDLHFHDLRATGATLLAQSGANVAEVQAFLGDSTATAALRYVRAAESRMDTLTDKLSQLAERGQW